MTSSAIEIKSKTELGIAENKSITIEAIQAIEIKKFRSFEERRIELGSNVTVLVGRNGTMKTSLLGLIAHPFSSESKDAFGTEERKAYAAKLRKEGDAPNTRGLPATPASASSSGGKNGSFTKPTRNNRGREHDRTVIPVSFKSHISKDKVLKRIYDELRTLDADFVFSAAYLLRALIEQTCLLYLKQQNKGKMPPKELHQKIEAVEKLLEADGIDDRVRKNLRVMANNKDSTASPDTLGHFVHGGAIPSKHDVFRIWDNISEPFAYIYSKLK